MAIEKYKLISPTEKNGYCVFDPHLENDKYVFFHMTPAVNQDSILKNGFCSAQELQSGNLASVSYAKKSFGCFAHLGCEVASDLVIFAVRFTPESLNEIVINPSDILVYKKHIQPKILGIVQIPAGLRLS